MFVFFDGMKHKMKTQHYLSLWFSNELIFVCFFSISFFLVESLMTFTFKNQHFPSSSSSTSPVSPNIRMNTRQTKLFIFCSEFSIHTKSHPIFVIAFLSLSLPLPLLFWSFKIEHFIYIMCFERLNWFLFIISLLLPTKHTYRFVALLSEPS